MVPLPVAIRRAAPVSVLALAPVLLAGCGGGVRLNSGFVEDLARAIGHTTEDVRLPQSTLDDLARQAEVDSEVVARSAQRASEPAVVSRTATTLDTELDGDEIAKGAALELACGQLQNPHPITWAEVFTALGTSASDAAKPRGQQLYDAVQQLLPDFRAAQNSDDPDERTSVVLMCFYAQNAN
jgi:hypothetical protein